MTTTRHRSFPSGDSRQTVPSHVANTRSPSGSQAGDANAAMSRATLAAEPAALIEALGETEGWTRYRLALPAASPARETLATALIAAGLPLREIAEERIGLEDIFIAATRRSPAELRRP